MIAKLAGLLDQVMSDGAVIDVGGVGYLVRATAADGAGLRIEHVVDKIHPALMLEIALIREPNGDRVLDIAR